MSCRAAKDMLDLDSVEATLVKEAHVHSIHVRSRSRGRTWLTMSPKPSFAATATFSSGLATLSLHRHQTEAIVPLDAKLGFKEIHGSGHCAPVASRFSTNSMIRGSRGDTNAELHPR